MLGTTSPKRFVRVRPPLSSRLPEKFWFAFRKFRPQIRFYVSAPESARRHYKIGWHHIVFLNHPDYFREVLAVQNDNFIKERTVQRTKMLLGEGMIQRKALNTHPTPGSAARVPSSAHSGRSPR